MNRQVPETSTAMTRDEVISTFEKAMNGLTGMTVEAQLRGQGKYPDLLDCYVQIRSPNNRVVRWPQTMCPATLARVGQVAILASAMRERINNYLSKPQTKGEAS
jgi:hypothetical protein